MFNDDALTQHIDDSQALEVEAGCFIELNQNDPTNIDIVGVFKYGAYPNSVFNKWTGDPNHFFRHENLSTDMRNATVDDDLLYVGGRPKSDYFSLADCFTDFRPRSGILKAVQPFTKDQVYVDDFLTVRRPRYYVPSVKDQFKYWTSWNTDYSKTVNVGLSDSDGRIQNAAPFAIYKEPIAANKVTVKMQTGNGEPANTRFASGKDPLSNPAKSTIPRRWRIDYLNVHDTWVTAMSFGEFDPTVLVPHSGTIDIVYSIVNPYPSEFENFVLKGYIPSTAHLPYVGRIGEAFVIGRSPSSLGKVVVWDGTEWRGADEIESGNDDTVPDVQYSWKIFDYSMNPEEYAVQNFVNPPFYNPTATNGDGDYGNEYSEFVMMKGIRVVVEEMLAPFRAFDLIELSPRLFANVSNNVIEYTVDKAISEDSLLPVGDMSVSNGTITLSNMDMVLNREMKFDPMTRKGSILAGRVRRNTKFLLYEIIKNVDVSGVKYDKFVPVKTLYATERPSVVSGTDDVNVTLRDLTFLFEERKAQNIVLRNASLTKAVAVLLDYVGFSNYIFHLGEKKNFSGQTSPLDTIIPYFFVNETMSVAEALQALAVATQCAMFFDEYNNFVVMPREHFATDPVYTLRGGSANQDGRTNIESIDGVDTQIISDVDITFTHRDIARERVLNYRSGRENASTTQGESANTLGYKVSQLWDASKLETNVLGVGVLRTSLPAITPKLDPSVVDGIRNNSFDVGMWAELFPEFKGLVMINGEIIRFDAKQYNIDGRNIWVTSQNHLKELTGRSKFRRSDGSGQMVYPTGLMRIYTEISSDLNGNSSLIGHGRGMFGTPITSHPAEPVEWINAPTYTHADTALDTVFGIYEPSNYNYGAVAVARETTSAANVTNYIYNPMHSRNSPTQLNPINIRPSDVALFESDRRIMRSSALTFSGPKGFGANKVSKKIKRLKGDGYTLFGTRIGIVGNTLNQESQSPFGSMVLGEFKMNSDDAEMQSVIGAGGGLMFGSSRLAGGSLESNDGYYFEITALNSSYSVSTENDVEQVVFSNVNFYKINSGTAVPATLSGGNVAVKLWSSYMDVRVTSGSQMARDRLMTDYNVVYDLAVEVKEQTTTKGVLKTFYLYVNDMIVGIVEDMNAISGATGKVYHPLSYQDTEVGVFVRGSSTIQVEHIYAVGTNKFNDSPITIDQKVYKRPRSFRIFSPSAIWSTVALAGGPENSWRYYEEFGSMARECRRIDATFDMYPVLKSKIAKQPIFDKAYSVTHYTSDPYGASMMIWAQSDRSIRLTDDVALNIHGLTLADNAEQTLGIDDFLTGKTDGSHYLKSYNDGIRLRNKLLALRASGATEKVELDSIYIQNRDYAEKMFGWLVGFVGAEKSKILLSAFGVPHLQIGDIVTIDYDIPLPVEKKANKGEIAPNEREYNVDMISFEDNNKRFIVRQISINRTVDGPEYSLDLVELPDNAYWLGSDF